MKTKEELNALKEEVEKLNKKLAELSDEELEQITGGNSGDMMIGGDAWGECSNPQCPEYGHPTMLVFAADGKYRCWRCLNVAADVE